VLSLGLNWNRMKEKHSIIKSFVFIMILTIGHSMASAQQANQKVRIAKIEIYSAYLDEYRTALAVHAKTAVQVEPGVLALEAVYDKVHPTRVTVFEVYASEETYQAHLKTPHFLKYKNTTLKMVKSLELVEVASIAIEIKPELMKHKQ
jgi:quinol monooxygenase YgiN